MNAKGYFFSAAFLVLTSTTALSANQWKNEMPLLSVMGRPDGGFVLTGPANSDPLCGGGGASFYVQSGQNGQTAEGVKAALAIALSAFATGKSVTLLYDNANATCYVQIVQINSN